MSWLVVQGASLNVIGGPRNHHKNKNNMGTISKVKSVQGDGDYTNNYGTFYKFEYNMEDGMTLSASHKTADGNFKPGDVVEYEVKGENDFGKYGKVGKPQEQQQQRSFKGGTKGGNASFALAYAKDLAVAHINGGRDFTSKDILAVANEFNDWLNSH